MFLQLELYIVDTLTDTEREIQGRVYKYCIHQHFLAFRSNEYFLHLHTDFFDPPHVFVLCIFGRNHYQGETIL